MKKFIFNTVAVAMLCSTLFPGCKKGEGDPFLSLRSRTARIAGDWTIKSWKEESSFSYSFLDDGEMFLTSGGDKTEIGGGAVSMSSSGTQTSPSGTASFHENSTGSATAEMRFQKDGNFRKTVAYKNTVSTYVASSGQIIITTFNQTTETLGKWNFLGGVGDDFKNKERMILHITTKKTTYDYTDSHGVIVEGSENETFSNSERSEVWQLTTLKNKEMVMKAETKNTGTYGSATRLGSQVNPSSENSSDNGTIEAILVQ